jgi:hypothetical protein
MRSILVVAAMFTLALQVSSQGAPPKTSPPKIPVLRLTSEEQAASDASSGAGAPLLEWIKGRSSVLTPDGAAVESVPDFRVTAPKGNLVMRRELVESDGAFGLTQAASYAMDISADAHPDGVLPSGGWVCGVAKYFITLRTYVIDASGRHSNALRYTIHCNGG